MAADVADLRTHISEISTAILSLIQSKADEFLDHHPLADAVPAAHVRPYIEAIASDISALIQTKTDEFLDRQQLTASDAAANLRSRVGDISEHIMRFEETKSEIKGQLNALLDPVSRLPLEVASVIFEYCLPSAPRPYPSAPPMIFLSICRSWRNIALSIPDLWAVISISTRVVSVKSRRLIDRWVARAGTRPLSLTLQGEVTPAAHALIDQYVPRAQTLELHHPSGLDLQAILARASSLPLLKTLIIRKTNPEGTESDEDDSYAKVYSDDGREILQMLSAAPNLISCALHSIYLQLDFQDALDRGLEPVPLTHPNLAYLCTGVHGGTTEILLQYLTLPSLQHLSISHFDIPFEDLLAFFTRSSSPLKTLAMTVSSISADDGAVGRFLQLVSALENMDMKMTDMKMKQSVEGEHFVFSIIAAIGSSTQHLPNLKNLTIRGDPLCLPRYEQVLGALAARRGLPHSQIKTFNFFWA